MVWRRRRVIDDRRSGHRPARSVGIGDVGHHDFNPGWKAGDRMSGDGPNRELTPVQLIDHGSADWSDTDNRVNTGLWHDDSSSPRLMRRTARRRCCRPRRAQFAAAGTDGSDPRRSTAALVCMARGRLLLSVPSCAAGASRAAIQASALSGNIPSPTTPLRKAARRAWSDRSDAPEHVCCKPRRNTPERLGPPTTPTLSRAAANGSYRSFVPNDCGGMRTLGVPAGGSRVSRETAHR